MMRSGKSVEGVGKIAVAAIELVAEGRLRLGAKKGRQAKQREQAEGTKRHPGASDQIPLILSCPVRRLKAQSICSIAGGLLGSIHGHA
jgi:hypothetical protein